MAVYCGFTAFIMQLRCNESTDMGFVVACCNLFKKKTFQRKLQQWMHRVITNDMWEHCSALERHSAIPVIIVAGKQY